jgi:cyclohexa-1,5-dienecarbonyl-CoA hydratase
MVTQLAATETKRIALNLRPPAAYITLHHPPLNVIDIPLMDELSSALAAIEARADLPVLVLQGSTAVFSAGVDVGAHTPEKIQEMLTKFHAIVSSLVTSRKVTIAAVHGHCLGGGAELAMVCDMVITSETATWGFPEIKLACYPPVAVTALASLIGHKQAADLILTGRTIDGKEAARIGLATRAVPDDDVEAALKAKIDCLAKLSPAALSLTKQAIYHWNAAHFDKGLVRAEKIYLEELMKTHDAQEGISAFLEKRQPTWKGK